MNGLVRFGEKEKLCPLYMVFHLYVLKNCIGDQVFILPLEGLGVNENLSYEEIPV